MVRILDLRYCETNFDMNGSLVDNHINYIYSVEKNLSDTIKIERQKMSRNPQKMTRMGKIRIH